MKPVLSVLSFLLILAGLPASNSMAQEVKKNDVVWIGCGVTKKAFLAEAATVYEENTGNHIEVIGGSATLGIRDAASGKADIGGACRPCKPEMSDKETGVKMTHVAWDALVIIVHPENPIYNLSTKQVKKIFSGKIRNWKEVGGGDLPIVVVARRGKTSGVGYMARKLIFGDERAEFTRHAIRLKSSGPVEKRVEETRNAIAISGVSSAKKRKVDIPALNGVKPVKKNIANGRYPLFRPLYLITKGEPKGESKMFMDWILSDEGQKVISEQGTTNLKEGEGLVSKFKYWEHTDKIRNLPASYRIKTEMNN